MENNMQNYRADSDITVLETEYIFYMKRPEGFVFAKEDTEHCIMALIIGGSARYQCGEESFTVQAGDILFLPQRVSYTAQVTSPEPWEHIVISFSMGEDADLDRFPVETVNKVVRGSRFEELFRQAHAAWSQCAYGYKIQVKAIITQILFQLISENFSRLFGSNTALSSLKAAADYMEQNYMRKISVEELAALSGYSASHFARIFSNVYGVPPIQYLNQIRILHAKNLLRANQHTLNQIAQKCGFSNVYYFSRCFKQITGTTPAKW